MKDFLKSNFDKLLLAALLIFFVLMAVHYSSRPSEQSLADDAKLILGALLTLITGQRLMQRNGDNGNGNGNGKSTLAPTPAAPSTPEATH